MNHNIPQSQVDQAIKLMGKEPEAAIGSCFLSSLEAFSVVHDKHILIIKIVYDVTEMFVLDLPSMAMNHHHTGILTFFSRILSNKI